MSLNESLLETLKRADVVCKDCGQKYGKYSVGCSSSWMGICNVCGLNKSVTEVRDYGYLSKGIQAETIKQQSKEVAVYMLKNQEPILSDEELEEVLSYQQGEINLKLTEEEIGFLNECLDTIQEWHPTLQPGEVGYDVPEDVALFEGIEKKITDLYEDHCVKYSLSPALVAYNQKYGTWGSGSPEEEKRWEGFRDAFVMLAQEKDQ